MAEVKRMTDPFTGKQVEISERLVDRLRGKYAVGPTLPNGEPEFGWRQHETPPIQHEAADTISRLTAERDGMRKALAKIRDANVTPDRGASIANHMRELARGALATPFTQSESAKDQ